MSCPFLSMELLFFIQRLDETRSFRANPLQTAAIADWPLCQSFTVSVERCGVNMAHVVREDDDVAHRRLRLSSAADWSTVETSLSCSAVDCKTSATLSASPLSAKEKVHINLAVVPSFLTKLPETRREGYVQSEADILLCGPVLFYRPFWFLSCSPQI